MSPILNPARGPLVVIHLPAGSAGCGALRRFLARPRGEINLPLALSAQARRLPDPARGPVVVNAGLPAGDERTALP